MTDYTTEQETWQQDMWGNPIRLDHGLAKVAAKVLRVIAEHREAAADDHLLIAYCWLEEDGLSDLLTTKTMQGRFLQWFCKQATFSETLTRCRRELVQKGVVIPEAEATARRAVKQENWHNHYRRR